MTTTPQARTTSDAAFPLAPIPPRCAQGLGRDHHHVDLYVAGATHLRDFLKPLGITAFKVGITGCRDAQRRVEDLRRKRYASVLKRPDDDMDTGVELDHGNEWFLVPLQTDWLDGSALPAGVELIDNVVRLRVSNVTTVKQVDNALHAALKPRTLSQYLAMPDGQARLHEIGRDPALQLHTRYTLMTSQARLSKATEVYLIRPRRELQALIAMAVDVIKTLENTAKNPISQ
jgi:hypothetical protein